MLLLGGVLLLSVVGVEDEGILFFMDSVEDFSNS